MDIRHKITKEILLSVDSLQGCDLSGANLRGAMLRGADLTDADLTDADLTDANLSHARLSGAVLHSADLSGALLQGAVFVDAAMAGVKLHGADSRWCIGDGQEIISIQDRWMVCYVRSTKELSIGCQAHPISDWMGFNGFRIGSMSKYALDWWRKWRPIIASICEYTGPMADLDAVDMSWSMGTGVVVDGVVEREEETDV